jgi:hypothetical protein
MPSGRCRPSGLGMYCRRDGFARQAPRCTRPCRSARLASRSASSSCQVRPSTPGAAFALQLVKREAQQVDVHMVQERRQPDPFIPPCGATYAVHRLGYACPALSLVRAAPDRIALGPAPSLHRLRGHERGLVRRLHRYYERVRLPLAVHHRIGAFRLADADRAGGRARAASRWISRFPCRRLPRVQEVSRPRRAEVTLALARHPCCLPLFSTASALRMETFRGSMLRPRVPLSTLRRRPRDRPRMTRGHRDWLGLPRAELASATTCRSPGAQRGFDDSVSAKTPVANPLSARGSLLKSPGVRAFFADGCAPRVGA